MNIMNSSSWQLHIIIPYRSRPVTHFKLQCVTIHNLLMGNIALVIRSAIQLHRLNIDILTAYSRSQDRKSFAVCQMHLHFWKYRSSDLILATDRINRVESHGAKHKPSGHLPTVLITANTVRGIQIQIM